jgi:hypothetical protein
MSHHSRIAAALAASAVAIALSGCGVFDQPLLDNGDLSGTSTTQERDVRDFTGVELRGSGDVTVEVGPEFSVTVTTDSGLQEHITTTVKNDTLVIHQKFSWIGASPDIEYTVTLPELDTLTLAGSGAITATKVDADHLTVESAGSGAITATGTASSASAELAGSGLIDLTGLDLEDATVEIAGSGTASISAQHSLEAEIAGSGNIIADGRVTTLSVDIAGSGDFLGKDLVARDARIDIAGSGDVYAGVRATLAVSTVGSGDVVYYGSPKIEFDNVGSGTVTAG